MHNIVYIGSHFIQRFTPAVLADFKILEGSINEQISTTEIAIVIIDVCQSETDPLASASHIKSYFNDESLVFLMLYDASTYIEKKYAIERALMRSCIDQLMKVSKMHF